MFKLKKAIEKYLDNQIKELKQKDKKEMKEDELQLILALEEIERKNKKI